MRHGKYQRGFTLIEVMIASVAGGLVILAATAFLLTVLRWYDEINAHIAMNRHAREMYDVMAYGGTSATIGHDGTYNIYSVRGQHNAPGNGMRNNYAFQYKSNNIQIMPDLSAPMTIPCVAAANPLPDCSGGLPPPTKNVQGWLGQDVTFSPAPRSVAGKTVEGVFVIIDPYQVQRAYGPALFSDTYRTVFTLNRNESDP